MRSKLFKLIAWAGVCLALQLQQMASAAEPFRWDDKVQRGQLENGFSYYIVDGGKAMGGQVSLQLMVRVGSLDERDDQSGVAHMVEHMVFKASRAHPEGVHAYMERQGWRIGRHYNAQTNFERTLYQLVTHQKDGRLDAGLGALAEIAGGALIPADALERERKVILEEWRTKLGVRERMDKQRRAMLRAGSLYPERPTIGTEASIREQSAAALQAFYRDWYRPANMALIVVGDVDAKALASAIAARFGALVPAALPARNAADPRLMDQLRIVRMQDAESGSSQVGWVSRFSEDKRQDSDGLRARIIDRIAQRSVQATVRKAAEQLPGGVESLTSSKGELGETTASLGFAARVAVDGHRSGLRQILQVQERLRREGVHADDVAHEIAEVRRLNEKGPAQQAARDFDGWQRQVGEAVQGQRVLQDPLQKRDQIRAIADTVTLADVNARVRQWLAAPDRVVFMMAPGLSPLTLPSIEEVARVQQELAQQTLPPLVKPQQVLAQATLPQPTSSGSLLGSDELGQGVQRWRLENGDVVVWHAQPKETVMRFAAQSGAGYRLPGAPSWQWQLAAQLGRDADLVGQSAGELGRWRAERKLQLSQQQSETQMRTTGAVPSAQLEDLLRLYAAHQTGSELTMDALSAVSRQLARQSARRPSSANDRMGRELSRLRYGELPLDGSPDAAGLRALVTPQGLATVRQQWQQLGAQPVTYFLSGPVDEATVRQLVGRYLAGIPRRATEQAAAAKPLLQRGGYHVSRLEIGIEPQGSVRAMGSQPLDWTPERAMRTAILARIAYRQLRQELRENEAGIYRLSYTLSLEPRDRLASELSFTAAPERLDALWTTARRVLERLPEQLDTAMLNEEIKRMRGEESRRVSDSTALFSRLQLSYNQFGDARYLGDSKRLTDGLTVDSMRTFAREFKLGRDLAVVKMLPKAREGSAVSALVSSRR